ncbi:MAG: hypothetical protein KIT84_08515 [Labilithrix sp.]|nr:hypothetical protein [Labilithrix sp.]MCW5811041.1 hypothetical protein [Labilithrix sp.]
MRSRWGCLVVLAACARPAPAQAPASAPAPAPPPVVVAAAPAPALPTRLAIDVTTDGAVEDRVVVELRLAGRLAATTALVFRPSHRVAIGDVEARDEDGPIAVDASLKLARPGRRELRVRYAVTFTPSPSPSPSPSPLPADATAPAAESIELHAAGDDLLALPELDEHVPVELKLRTAGMGPGGASSFGLGADQRFEARTSELHNAYFLAGDVGTATFHAPDGDDFTAWVGHTAFDPRWIGAEAAATRSAIDAYVGRHAGRGSAPLSLLVVPAKRDDPPVVVAPRTRGLFVSADRRAVWTAPIRILVGQALAQRYLGGFLWVGARDAAREGEGWFFSEGFARAVSRDVLFDLGMIEASDRANELNELLAAIAFAPDERRVALARGALLATALDVAARKNGSSLRQFLRERLADAAAKKTDTIARDDFVAHARRAAGDAFADAMTATLTRGAEVPLPPDLLGRCWRLARKQLVPFELGFVTTAGQDLVVESVKPGSRAAAAGVRKGDIVRNLDYRNGQSASPVKMTLLRGERSLTLTFLPAGAAKPGRIFERIPAIPDDRC